MSANVPSEVVARVKKGAALLDQKAPGWRIRVRSWAINVGSSANCVLGQIYGDYYWGCERLHLQDSYGHGFSASISHEFLDAMRYYDTLNEAWRKELEAA